MAKNKTTTTDPNPNETQIVGLQLPCTLDQIQRMDRAIHIEAARRRVPRLTRKEVVLEALLLWIDSVEQTNRHPNSTPTPNLPTPGQSNRSHHTPTNTEIPTVVPATVGLAQKAVLHVHPRRRQQRVYLHHIP